MSEANSTAFHHSPDGHWEFHDGRAVFEKLPANLYSLSTGRFGAIHLVPATMEVDEVVPLPNPQALRAKTLAARFLSGEFDESLKSMGLLKKMAMLLWGVPGTSKSVTIFEITGDAIRKGWIVIRATTNVDLLVDALRAIRAVEPDRGIMVIWEEFEDVVTHREASLLELLDGGNQIPGVFYIMTTNYIKMIPPRIFLRMRRIPFQVEFMYPGDDERRAFFNAKIPAARAAEIDVEDWVIKTKGFSLDQCAQVILAVFAFQSTIEAVIEDLALRLAAVGAEDPEADDAEDDEYYEEDE